GRVRARLVTGAPRRAHPRPRGAREAGGAPRRNARAPHSAKMIVTERRRRRRIWLQIDDRRVGRYLAIPQNAPIQPTPSVHRRLDYPAALGLDRRASTRTSPNVVSRGEEATRKANRSR